jgi:hypothetical protein
MANQVQNQPTTAYTLSLIGGIFGILLGLLILVLGAVVGVFTFGLGFGILGGIGLWSLISSVLVITFAQKLKENPNEHGKWGALILVFSIIGVMGFLGAVFAFIGGILAIVYNPTPANQPASYAPAQQPYYGPPPQPASYQQPQAHVCPQCGTQLQANARFCPNCGKQQY